jgi:site-specific DNA recombinase
VVSEQDNACIRENATKALSQDEYNSRYDRLIKRYQKATAKLEKLHAEKADRQNRERELRGFIDALMTSPFVLDTWDEQLWTLLVVKGSVQRDGSIEFEFSGEERVVAN